MKLFIELLKWLGRGILIYPFGLAYTFIDSSGNIGQWFWLEVLIIDFLVCILLFLFLDFKLIERIKNKKHK